VVDALADARLLTVTEGEVELSHEALLREWPRYRGWLDEDRVNRRIHAHLTAAAAEWDAEGRDPSELYRGSRLSGALDWAAGHPDQVGPVEDEFIAAGTRRAERSARRVRAGLVGVSLLFLASLIAGFIALRQKQNATTAARVALARQLGAEATSEPRIDRAMLLAREAVKLDGSPQVQSALLATLLRAPAVIGSFPLPSDSGRQLALSPDGRTLTVSGPGSAGGILAFYDPHTHTQQRSPLNDVGIFNPPAYSRDGSLLAYSSGGEFVVRDAHSLAVLYRLAPDQTFLAHQTATDDALLIGPDRRTVYLAYSLFDAAGRPTGAYLDRWALPRAWPASTARAGYGPFLALSVNDRGARVIAVTSGSVKIFDAHTLRLVRSITTTAAGPQTAAAVSPDGRSILVGSGAGSVSFVDVSTGRVRRAITGHSGAVASAVYSPHGRTAVTVGDDDKVIIWNARTATQAEVLTGTTGQVQSAAISADGSTLYTSSVDGVVAWDLAGNQRFGRGSRLAAPRPCCDPVSPLAPPVAVSPDGSRFAVPVDSGAIGLFSTRTLERQSLFTVTPNDTGITALAWSPAGSELAVAGHSGIMQLWNVEGAPRLERSLVGLRPFLGRPEAIQAIAFSADGSLTAASDLAQTPAGPGNNPGLLANLAIWRAATGRLVVPARALGLGPPRPITFSGAGSVLAVGRADGGASILDASTGRSQRTIDPSAYVDALAFAPDGTLAIGSDSGKVQLWNVRTGKQRSPPVRVATGSVASISFDSSGRRFTTTGFQYGTVKLWFRSSLQQQGTSLPSVAGTTSTATFAATQRLLVVDDHGSVFVWPTSLAAWEQRACTIAGRSLTHDEWAQFLPGRAYTRTCP
jgi:WD40 repeat protein